MAYMLNGRTYLLILTLIKRRQIVISHHKILTLDRFMFEYS